MNDFQYKCETLDDVMTTLCTLDKKEYIYVIHSKGFYYVEGPDSPFIRNGEKVLYKGKVINIVKRMYKNQTV